MEKDINELEIEQYKKYKNELIDALSQYEEIYDEKGNKTLKPLFQEGKKYEKILDVIDPNFEGVAKRLTDYDNELEEDGFVVRTDNQGYITKLSDKLVKYQNYRIEKELIKDKALTDKVKCFNELNIDCKIEELDDVIGISKGNISLIKDEDGNFDLDTYKMMYPKYLNMYLEKLIKTDYLAVFEKDPNAMDSILKNYDSYFRGVVQHKLLTPEDKKLDLPEFGGLYQGDIKDEVLKVFAPAGKVEIDREFHENNHLETIKGYTQEERQELAEKCRDEVDSLTSRFEGPEAKKGEKVMLLLNAREYMTAIKKVYKTCNPFLRLIGVGKAGEYAQMKNEMISKLVKATGFTKSECKEFFKNTKPRIKFDGKTYNYNKIYSNSKKLEDQLCNFSFNDPLKRMKMEIEQLNDAKQVNLNNKVELDVVNNKEIEVGKK